MFLPLRALLDHAAEHNYGVAAFNVNNLEQIQAIMDAAHETDAPVIVQATPRARAYMRDGYLRSLMLASRERYPQLPIVLHFDRGNSLSSCTSAVDCGFSSVMINGSFMEDQVSPSTWRYNVEVTRDVVQMARRRQISVEGDLGGLTGPLPALRCDIEEDQPDWLMTDAHGLTDPEAAERFVAATQVDCLAVSIGTSQGAYKFTRRPTGDILDLPRIAEIHRRLPNTHLVMHGSSSVPLELQDMMNRYGGDIRPTWGIPLEEIQRSIQHGIRKINVDTDNRLAMTGAIRRVLFEQPECFDPREYLGPARQAIHEICKSRIIAFGQAGRAAELRAAGILPRA